MADKYFELSKLIQFNSPQILEYLFENFSVLQPRLDIILSSLFEYERYIVIKYIINFYILDPYSISLICKKSYKRNLEQIKSQICSKHSDCMIYTAAYYGNINYTHELLIIHNKSYKNISLEKMAIENIKNRKINDPDYIKYLRSLGLEITDPIFRMSIVTNKISITKLLLEEYNYVPQSNLIIYVKLAISYYSAKVLEYFINNWTTIDVNDMLLLKSLLNVSLKIFLDVIKIYKLTNKQLNELLKYIIIEDNYQLIKELLKIRFEIDYDFIIDDIANKFDYELIILFEQYGMDLKKYGHILISKAKEYNKQIEIPRITNTIQYLNYKNIY